MTTRLSATGNRLLRWTIGPVLRPVTHALLHSIVRVRWNGRERIPPEGPVMFVANHHGIVDAAILTLCIRPYVATVAKAELFGPPPARLFFRALGAIPVRRGATDVSMLRAAQKVLRGGHALAIFPEGAISSFALRRLRAGAVRIALDAGAPVVPLGICGNEGMADVQVFRYRFTHLRRLPVSVSVGEPWQIAADPAASDLGDLTQEMGRRIAALLPADKRGPYG